MKSIYKAIFSATLSNTFSQWFPSFFIKNKKAEILDSSFLILQKYYSVSRNLSTNCRSFAVSSAVSSKSGRFFTVRIRDCSLRHLAMLA